MSTTYAVVAVSPRTYEEISRILRAAGYDHVFITGPRGEQRIHMDGLALSERSFAPEEERGPETKVPYIAPVEVQYQG